MVQLWINLPAKDKMSAPKYQEILHNNMGRYELENNSGVIEVIAGEYQGVKGPAFTFTPIQVYNARLNAGGRASITVPGAFNTGILVIEGSAHINDEAVTADHFVLFKNDGEQIDIVADAGAVLLVLSGEPINEPIAQYGPFLMNTWAEVEQAIEDVSAGKFGVLED
jgi:redox-sensitive bicupin YhaK (pirin superfamily)